MRLMWMDIESLTNPDDPTDDRPAGLKKSPFELTADPRMMEDNRARRNWKKKLKKGSNFEDRGTP